MIRFVLKTLDYGGEENKFKENRPTPFLFDSDSKNQDSTFEVYFTLPNDKRERTYN